MASSADDGVDAKVLTVDKATEVESFSPVKESVESTKEDESDVKIEEKISESAVAASTEETTEPPPVEDVKDIEPAIEEKINVPTQVEAVPAVEAVKDIEAKTEEKASELPPVEEKVVDPVPGEDAKDIETNIAERVSEPPPVEEKIVDFVPVEDVKEPLPVEDVKVTEAKAEDIVDSVPTEDVKEPPPFEDVKDFEAKTEEKIVEPPLVEVVVDSEAKTEEKIVEPPAFEDVKDSEAKTEEKIVEPPSVEELKNTEAQVEEKVREPPPIEDVKDIEPKTKENILGVEDAVNIEPKREEKITEPPVDDGKNIDDVSVGVSEDKIEDKIYEPPPVEEVKDIEAIPVSESETKISDPSTEEVKDIEAAPPSESESKLPPVAKVVEENVKAEESTDVAAILEEQKEKKLADEPSDAPPAEESKQIEEAAVSKDITVVEQGDTSEQSTEPIEVEANEKSELPTSENSLVEEKEKAETLEKNPYIETKLVNAVGEPEDLSTGITDEIQVKDVSTSETYIPDAIAKTEEDIIAADEKSVEPKKIVTETQVPEAKTEKESVEPVQSEEEPADDATGSIPLLEVTEKQLPEEEPIKKDKTDQTPETKLGEEKPVADTPDETLQPTDAKLQEEKDAPILETTKTLQEAFHKDDVPVKKPSIVKIVKHSFSKAKKAILGKSHNTKSTEGDVDH